MIRFVVCVCQHDLEALQFFVSVACFLMVRKRAFNRVLMQSLFDILGEGLGAGRRWMLVVNTVSLVQPQVDSSEFSPLGFDLGLRVRLVPARPAHPIEARNSVKSG